MNFDAVRPIVDAVLYEGYILYPYRASAGKNRQRFNFGTLYPRDFSESQRGSDAWTLQCECLAVGANPQVEICVRFLQLTDRRIEQQAIVDGEPCFTAVARLAVGEATWQAWQEACERDATVELGSLRDIAQQPREVQGEFPARRECESLRDAAGVEVGRLVRDQRALSCRVEASAEPIEPDGFRLSLRVSNVTTWQPPGVDPRSDALLSSLASLHVVMGVAEGEFISLLDPPAAYQTGAAACRNVGVWPVLVGEPPQRQMLLASPIILYDYPEIAPESTAEYCDGTEIDEMLALRVLTLTEDEKREMRGVDERARRILEQTETLPPEQMSKLHGAIRGLRRVANP